ncbi:hypothetical protein ARSEF1564_008807 [Beauveria bassiana]
MFKIPRTSRSFSVTSRGVLPEIRGTQRPPDWDYADDQIPAWKDFDKAAREAENQLQLFRLIFTQLAWQDNELQN